MRASRVEPVLRRKWTAACALWLLTTSLAGSATAAPSRSRMEIMAQVAGWEGLVERSLNVAQRLGSRLRDWYATSNPWQRVAWGGLAACVVLGLGTTVDRTLRIRRGRVIPTAFRKRFVARLRAGQLSWNQGLDYCELNPSPAARVAAAALGRWGRPEAELERAVEAAVRSEVETQARGTATLRRIAALAPLVGLLGCLTCLSDALAKLPVDGAWNQAVASSLWPLAGGVALAIVALLAYDGLAGRVECLGAELERVGAETVDALKAAVAGRFVRAEDSTVGLGGPHGVGLGSRSDATRGFDRVESRGTGGS